ncbi:MAG: YceD family protein [Halothiobacillaceae bacterium]|nr:YceD family protein [Halothiobacillaceae bacterium]
MSEKIDPIRLAERSARLQGVFSLGDLGRLRELLVHTQGQVEYDLSFCLDKEGRRLIVGHVRAALPLICQRCLEPFEFPVDAEVTLCPVFTDSEAAALPVELEPCMMDEERQLCLTELVEDELLVRLPTSPRHPEPCGLLAPEFIEPREHDTPSSNPFAVLARLKT